jgi:hypothetical protein
VENVNLPKSKPKLVIGCFISPQDTILKATVTNNFPIGSVVTGNGLVKDASVILSDGNSSINLNYTDSSESYTVPANLFMITPGKTYYLTITTPSGLTAKAQCTIPPTKNTSLDFSIDSVPSNYYGGYYHIKPTWTDILGETNYYRIYAELENRDVYYSYVYYNSFYSNNGDLDVITDSNNDGQKMSIKYLECYYSHYGYKSTINTYLLTIDKNYYEFERTSQSYADDPFSDPVNIYTNIEGGLGVFAGYQIYKLSKNVN